MFFFIFCSKNRSFNRAYWVEQFFSCKSSEVNYFNSHLIVQERYNQIKQIRYNFTSALQCHPMINTHSNDMDTTYLNGNCMLHCWNLIPRVQTLQLLDTWVEQIELGWSLRDFVWVESSSQYVYLVEPNEFQKQIEKV